MQQKYLYGRESRQSYSAIIMINASIEKYHDIVRRSSKGQVTTIIIIEKINLIQRFTCVPCLRNLLLLYWKEKETHILNFLTSDLYWEHYLSLYQQFIPININI